MSQVLYYSALQPRPVPQTIGVKLQPLYTEEELRDVFKDALLKSATKCIFPNCGCGEYCTFEHDEATQGIVDE